MHSPPAPRRRPAPRCSPPATRLRGARTASRRALRTSALPESAPGRGGGRGAEPGRWGGGQAWRSWLGRGSQVAPWLGAPGASASLSELPVWSVAGLVGVCALRSTAQTHQVHSTTLDQPSWQAPQRPPSHCNRICGKCQSGCKPSERLSAPCCAAALGRDARLASTAPNNRALRFIGSYLHTSNGARCAQVAR